MAATGLRALRAKQAGKGYELKTFVCTGAGANADVTCTGIKKGKDQIQSAVMIAAGVPSLIVCTIQADNTIRSTTASTGNKIIVNWWSAQ